MLLPITLVTAALAGLGNLALAGRVVQRRFKDQILVGDGGDPRLATRARSHANLAEYAPFVLILMGLIEAAGGSGALLTAIAGAFVVGRVAHAIGMEKGTANPWRAAGALATWVVLLILAGWALVLGVTAVRTPGGAPLPIEAPPTA